MPINSNDHIGLNPKTPAPNTYIHVTDAAAFKVYTLIQEEQNPDLKLRIFITGGGCSGFQYGFSFEIQKNEDDFEQIKVLKLTKDANGHFQLVQASQAANLETLEVEICILVDAQSFSYLQGAEVDYRQDLQGERFIVRNNPNTKTTCGCGSSFSVD